MLFNFAQFADISHVPCIDWMSDASFIDWILSILFSLLCSHSFVRVPPRSPAQVNWKSSDRQPSYLPPSFRVILFVIFDCHVFLMLRNICCVFNKLVSIVLSLISVVSLLFLFHLDPFFPCSKSSSYKWGLTCASRSCGRISCGIPHLTGPRRPHHSGHDEDV